MTIILETRRMALRVWKPDDLEAGFRLWGDPEVMRYVGEAEDRDGVARAIAAGAAHQMRHGVQHWAMEVDGEVIGCCGFHVIGDTAIGDTGDLELVTHVARSWWRQGYATEAVQACAAFLPERRLVAWTAEKNRGMQRVLEKAGFDALGAQPHWEDGVPELCYERKASIASP